MKELLKKSSFYNILVIAFFLLILISLYLFTRSSLITKQSEVFMLSRDVAVSEVESEIMEVNSIILNLESYLVTHENQDNFEPYIISVGDQYALDSAIYFARPDNTNISSPQMDIPDSFITTQRPWYLKAISNDGIVFTDAYLDVSEEKYIITGSKAVYKDGELLGVVAIDVDIEYISSFITEDVYDTGGYAFLVDSQNQLISCEDCGSNNSILETIKTSTININLFNEDNGITDKISAFDVVGKVAYSKIAGTEYYFGIFMPLDDINQNLRLFYIIGIAILGIICFGGLTVYFIYFKFFQKPLDTLIVDIDKINPKNNYEYRLPTGKKTGFSKARNALNSLLEDTQEYQSQAQNNLNELTFRNQKYNLLLDSASDIVFQIDTNRVYLEIFGRGLKKIKKVEKDFIGNKFEDVFGSFNSKTRNECYDLVFDGYKRVYSWEYVIDKKIIYFETALSPLYDLEKNIIGAVGVTRDITEQELRYQDMVNISNHDYLTGLRNRRYYIERLQILDTLKEYPFGVMNIDVNGLKIINDAYGHSTGDEALIKTANVLKATIEDNYIVSRVSGDEFTIILPKSDEAKTKALKEKLLKGFENIKISNLDLSVAIGYHVKSDDSKDIEEVRMLAENDMFRHKISERKSVKNKAISAILKTLTEKYEAEKIHSKIVTEYSKKLGEVLKLEADDIRDLTTAAMFHDIGKISIPDDIINKPGRLSEREYEIMKSHTEVGYEILRAADEYSELAIYASSHHERWDGTGYPRGLKGDKIPLFSRIISLADSFEAMTADRPYRKKQSVEYAASEIIKYSGSQFDPKLAKVFVEEVLKLPWRKS